jgi:hypothetical protein
MGYAVVEGGSERVRYAEVVVPYHNRKMEEKEFTVSYGECFLHTEIYVGR